MKDTDEMIGKDSNYPNKNIKLLKIPRYGVGGTIPK